MTVDLLIKNGTLLTINDDFQIIKDGAIIVDGGRIVDIGPSESLSDLPDARKVIDARGQLVMPGLINTHMHVGYTMLKGIASDIDNRQEWLSSVYPYVIKASPEDCYHATMLGCLEMIKGGTTCFIENNPFISDDANMDSMAEAVQTAGIRAALGRAFSDISAPEFLLCDESRFLAEFDRLFEKWYGAADDRIRIWIYAPGPGIRESIERMRLIKSLTARYDTSVSSHWAEGRGGRDFFQKRYDTAPPARFLKDKGYLDEKTLLVHVVDLVTEEIEMLEGTGVKIAHCPTSNTIRSSHPFEVAPVKELLDKKLDVGLGTDASICNDRSSMFETMKMAVLLQKLRYGDTRALIAKDALEMATMGGARVLGQEKEIGSLEKGKRADLIIIDLNQPHLQPIHNICENLVYGAMDSDVQTVLVNGRILMEDRVVKSVDEKSAMARIVETAANLDKVAVEAADDVKRMWAETYRERST